MKTDDRLESTRIGRYDGKQYVFTHRNPHTGEVWSDDIGEWVPSDQVKFAN